MHKLGVREDVALAPYTTLRVGGPARYLAEVSCQEQLAELLSWAAAGRLPWVALGRGSNLLVSDEGFEGLVLLLRSAQESWSITGERAYVRAGAGANLAALAARAAKQGWSGLEFASGIPASVGGAVAMNAGAHGRSLSDCLVEAVIWSEGELLHLTAQELNFGYRTCRLQKGSELLVEATFELLRAPGALERVYQFTEYRRRTQPWKAATAGCFFRNPNPCDFIAGERAEIENVAGRSAGALIEEAGLKGARIGGAEVSTLHANFLLNGGSARAADFIQLSAHIRHCVEERFGYSLKSEVRYLDPHQGVGCLYG